MTLVKSVYHAMFRSDQAAVLQQYRCKLENNLNAYKSMPQAVELTRQRDVVAELSSQMQETVAQRDDAQRQLLELCHSGTACSMQIIIVIVIVIEWFNVAWIISIISRATSVNCQISRSGYGR